METEGCVRINVQILKDLINYSNRYKILRNQNHDTIDDLANVPYVVNGSMSNWIFGDELDSILDKINSRLPSVELQIYDIIDLDLLGNPT